jgi:hypothetical protein
MLLLLDCTFCGELFSDFLSLILSNLENLSPGKQADVVCSLLQYNIQSLTYRRWFTLLETKGLLKNLQKAQIEIILKNWNESTTEDFDPEKVRVSFCKKLSPQQQKHVSDWVEAQKKSAQTSASGGLPAVNNKDSKN